MRVLLCHPGAEWSTLDVYNGLSWGLRQHGVDVVPYRLDLRMRSAEKALYFEYRQKKRDDASVQRPTIADTYYHACVWTLETYFRRQIDVVLIVSGMFFSLDAIERLKQANCRVCVLFTETPYDQEKELRLAKMVDGCWTNERSAVPAFREVNRNAGYLPHAWHPEQHYVASKALADIPSHDVVFVGSGFPERITWFNSIDWTGIDLGLYGTWKELGLRPEIEACVQGEQIRNAYAGALYRRAKVGLNLYRRSKGWAGREGLITHAESLSPRAYELAACGAFHLSDYREEVPEIFGDLVPTFTSPAEAERLIRQWVADDAGRARVASQLPACVAEKSWKERAAMVLGDLQRLMQASRAA